MDLGLYEQALIEAAGLRTPDFLGTFGVEDQNLDGFTMVNPYKSLLIPIQNLWNMQDLQSFLEGLQLASRSSGVAKLPAILFWVICSTALDVGVFFIWFVSKCQWEISRILKWRFCTI